MYDRQTESCWQQFLGEAIIGKMLGKSLTVLPSRLESWANFQARANASAMLPALTDARLRRCGANPYNRHDSSPTPFLYRGGALRTLKEVDVAPLAGVITVDLRRVGQEVAWALYLLRERGRLGADDGFIITWELG